MRGGPLGGCACAVSGQTVADPAIPLMKSRRRIAFPPRVRTTPTGLCNYISKARNVGQRNGVGLHFTCTVFGVRRAQACPIHRPSGATSLCRRGLVIVALVRGSLGLRAGSIPAFPCCVHRSPFPINGRPGHIQRVKRVIPQFKMREIIEARTKGFPTAYVIHRQGT